ncbi:MAG: extracellular solute-binding protein [Paenibacillaceae bacterium]|nr:extracellular solute-binding protein [Paenibacillaceae bacterium]
MAESAPPNSVFQNLKNAAAHFNEANPLIRIVFDYLPESAIKSSTIGGEAVTAISFSTDDMIELLESKNPPDIVPASPSDGRLFEAKGVLKDLYLLQKTAGSGAIDIERRLLDNVTVRGKLPLLPYAGAQQLVIYNKEPFDRANIPYPQADWTWEQFGDISVKLNPALAPELTYSIDTLELLMASTGKGLLSPDGETTVGYLDSPEAVRTLRWLNGFYREKGQSALKNSAESGMAVWQQFYKGQSGMYIGGIEIRYNPFLEGKKLGYAPLPHFAGGKRANPITFSGYGIANKSKHPEEAWKFITYITMSNNEDAIKLASSYVTTSKTLAEAAGQDSDSALSAALEEMKVAVNPADQNNRFFYKAWNENLDAQFQNLLAAKDEELPARLHDLALKVDQEMHRLQNGN